MPYTREHKEETRARIVQCAHGLFNRRGFSEVSIDEIMAAAGLTRGGFYNHFKTKEELFAEVMVAYVEARQAAIGGAPRCGPEVAQKIFDSYVSRAHLEDVDGHCPLMALPADVGRAGPAVRAAYRRVLEALVAALAGNLEPQQGEAARQHGMAIAAMCVGAMVLARTIADDAMADEIFAAARSLAVETIGAEG